jgi:hypothetical protein
MAIIHGKNGVVRVGSNSVAKVREFEFEEISEDSDSSAMGDTYRDHLEGMKSWTGSLSCWLDAADTNGQNALSAGAIVSLSLQPGGNASGDVKYSGSASIKKVTRKSVLDGIAEVSFDFKGKGALTQGTVT